MAVTCQSTPLRVCLKDEAVRVQEQRHMGNLSLLMFIVDLVIAKIWKSWLLNPASA